MSGVIKGAEGAAVVAILPRSQPVAVPPLPDPRLIALEQRVQELERALDEARTKAVRDVAAARAAGRGDVEADDARRIKALDAGIDAALAGWRDRLAMLDSLAASLCAAALEKVFGAATADFAPMVGKTLAHHLDRLGREAVVEIRVSGEDFPDAEAVAALAATAAFGQARIVVDLDLPAGACRLSLLLGEAELDPAMQWAVIDQALRGLETAA